MQSTLDYAFFTGHCFPLNESVALRASLPLLAIQSKRRVVNVWGKVFGHSSDYIIVQTFDSNNLAAPPNVFYSVDNGITFALLESPDSCFDPSVDPDAVENEGRKLQLLRAMQGIYVGDPAYEYRVTDPVTGITKSYRESQRLSLFIAEHDYHCTVAPRGAVLHESRNSSQPMGIKVNPAFAGVGSVGKPIAGSLKSGNSNGSSKSASQEALHLSNYYHVRQACPYKRCLLESEGVLSGKTEVQCAMENKEMDAPFTSLASDTPTGVWKLRLENVASDIRGGGSDFCFSKSSSASRANGCDAGLIVGENAMFRGSVFFHELQSKVYGTVYMGDGSINADVAWQL